MRIGIITTPYTPWGGSEELWAAMAEEAIRDGHDVWASIYKWPTDPPKVQALVEMGVKVQRRHPSLRRAKVGLLAARCNVSPFSRLLRSRPDVVFVSLGTTYECVKRRDLLHALYRASVPYVAVVHLNSDWLLPTDAERSITREFFRRASSVLFVSEANRRAVERQLAIALPNAGVIRNPVNMGDTNILPWPESGPVRMATVARLNVPQKGQDILLEALSTDEWRHRDWRLRLYGRGAGMEYLTELAYHYGVAERIDFQGQVADVREIWRDNHLFVMPSRAEGAPLALVEAMLCGRPSVVTDVGGITEWVEDGETAFVAAAPTPQSFGAALERAWRSRSCWVDIGRHAHDQALAQFDQEAGKTLLRILLQAADQPIEPVRGWSSLEAVHD